MARQDIGGLFSVNGNVTGQDGRVRQFRLPVTNPFPRLDRRSMLTKGRQGAASPNLLRTGAVLLDAQSVSLPEMTTDLAGIAAGYAVENVKRDRVDAQPWSRVGLGQLMGRMLGQGGEAVRP